jgi:arylsulfatase A-like enzyme
VGLVDLAPTFAQIAGIEPREWMEGKALPVDEADAAARGHEAVLTEWDSELFGVEVHLRSICEGGYLLTTYGRGSSHDGSEGELYDLAADPLQQVNLFDDPARASLRDDLIADLRERQPAPRSPRLDVVAPV